jgi:hypothetical protein
VGNSLRLHVIQNRLQRFQIAMNIAEHGKAHKGI